jgi:hypothetical protein
MTNLLLLILIGLVLFDIIDREFVQFRKWCLRQANIWLNRRQKLQFETRLGSDLAIAERLMKAEHIRKTPWYDNPIKRRHPEIWKMITLQNSCGHLFEEFEGYKRCKKCEVAYAR